MKTDSPWYSATARRQDGRKRRGSTSWEQSVRARLIRERPHVCYYCHEPITSACRIAIPWPCR
jgi:hypothetical protein